MSRTCAVDRSFHISGLRAVPESALPAMQLELFAEAGAIVAERASAAGVACELVARGLRRAAEQAGALAAATHDGISPR